VRPLAELLGVVLVVVGLSLAWLPLGIFAAGLALILAAHAPSPAEPRTPSPARPGRGAP
jgi:hypothetical protein